MSRVTIFHSNINSFMQRNELSVRGTGVAGQAGRASRIGDRMVAQARRNASGEVVDSRTGDLANSVVKILRPHPRGGITVGVGTTLEYGGFLENGTDPHTISISGGAFAALGRAPYLLKSGGPYDKPPFFQNKNPLRGAVSVNHPGNQPFHWLRKAVFAVVGRGGVV